MSLNQVMVLVRSMLNHQTINDFPPYMIIFFLHEYSRTYQYNDSQAINNNQFYKIFYFVFFR